MYLLEFLLMFTITKIKNKINMQCNFEVKKNKMQ